MTATATPTQAEALVANIFDQHYADFKAGRPYDDGPRLVYADWLEEQGECERAEFIRCQVKVEWWANNRGPHPVLGNITGGDAGGSLAISQALIERHGAEWMDCLPDGIRLDDGRPSASPTVRFVRGFPARFTLTARQAWGEACGRCGGSGEQRNWPEAPAFECRLCHGTGRVGAILPAILAACPVESVTVSGVEPHPDDQNVFAWLREGHGISSAELPIPVFDLISGHLFGEYVWKAFDSPVLAHAALSRAAIRHARGR